MCGKQMLEEAPVYKLVRVSYDGRENPIFNIKEKNSTLTRLSRAETMAVVGLNAPA